MRLEDKALALFGITGTLKKLPGDRDRNFHVLTQDNQEYLLKIASPEESPSVLEMQTSLLLSLTNQRQSFEFPIPKPSIQGNFIPTLTGENGETLAVRLFHYISGTLLGDIPYHSPGLCASLGRQIAELSLSLKPCFHPASARYLKWDLPQADWIADYLNTLENSQERFIVDQWLTYFVKTVKPCLIKMPRQIIHGDLNDYNLLARKNEEGEYSITGIIDFGDAVLSPPVCELAIALAYVMMNKQDPLATARYVLNAYQIILPLSEDERSILFPLIMMRLCVSVVNSALRKKENPEDPYLTISEKPAWELLNRLNHHPKNLDLSKEGSTLSTQEILDLRQQYFSRNLSLSYEKPLHIIRGLGQYLYDENGVAYLDGVNNVCHVGHCHPTVVRAGQLQMEKLNTNTRYLHESLVSYAQRLTATLPSPLEVCFFVSSGSEANELALRLARAHTQKKNWVVLDNAYHGNTSTLIEISPYKFKGKGGCGQPDFVQVLPMPDCLRGHHLTFEDPGFTEDTAGFIAESLLSCGGQIELPPGYLQAVYKAVRAVGGVCIADEIQVGFGRVGSHFWGFETQDVIPDIVTLGKPMGNGHPLGAVITTREIAESFCNGMEFFSTFGGNPVSCEIGKAVLQVLEEEKLQLNALAVGNALKSSLNHLKSQFNIIGDVRGLGFFLGIEIVKENETLIPAPELAEKIVNQMKTRHILLSTDGPFQNVIKFKPPMVLTQADADHLTTQLTQVLLTL